MKGHKVRIGISGWSYPPWRGVFYPPKLRQRDELRFASRAFSSIEINGSFYSLLRPENYDTWRSEAPRDFVFSVKGGRFITHMKRLVGVHSALANFFASGVLRLGNKLGPLLWQLPPSLAFDEARLRAFFELLPRSSSEAERLARQHDERLRERSALEFRGRPQRLRHTLEVRHPSFLNAHYLDLLREYGVASTVADTAGKFPLIEEVTANFAYVRLHGEKQLYVSGYSSADLAPWAARIEKWRKRLDVFVYFDNDVKVRAPFDAQNLARLVDGQPALDLPEALATVTEEPRTVWPAFVRRNPVLTPRRATAARGAGR